MNLSEKQLNHLVDIIKKDYGVEITSDEATEIATQLLRMTMLAKRHVYKRIIKNNPLTSMT